MQIRPLAEYTSFGIGGEAEILVLTREEDAWEALKVPHTVLGRGTNVLVSDRGVKDLVVINRLTAVVIDGERVQAGSGVTLPSLAAMCAERGLSGLEWACGIPGSVGGAVTMNAGAYGGEFAGVLEAADVIRGGKKVRLTKEECAMSYRSSGIGSGDFVTGALLRLKVRPREEILADMKRYTLLRLKSQPAGKSAGSVFTGGPRPAGAYIEEAGLKGAREGGAVISEKHANFILNAGGATAADVIKLMERAEEAVMKKFGVKLKREIRLIGEF